MNVRNKILFILFSIISLLSCSKIEQSQKQEYEYYISWANDNISKSELVIGTDYSQISIKKIKRIAKKDNDKYQLIWWYDDVQNIVLDECEEWNKFNHIVFYKTHL